MRLLPLLLLVPLLLAGCGERKTDPKAIEALEHEKLLLTARVKELETHLKLVEGERDACKGITPTPAPSAGPGPAR